MLFSDEVEIKKLPHRISESWFAFPLLLEERESDKIGWTVTFKCALRTGHRDIQESQAKARST